MTPHQIKKAAEYLLLLENIERSNSSAASLWFCMSLKYNSVNESMQCLIPADFQPKIKEYLTLLAKTKLKELGVE